MNTHVSSWPIQVVSYAMMFVLLIGFSHHWGAARSGLWGRFCEARLCTCWAHSPGLQAKDHLCKLVVAAGCCSQGLKGMKNTTEKS